MFENLHILPADPILGLMAQFRADTHPKKVDLGVGVYKDEQGHTPVMAAVVEAEKQILNTQTTKTYIGPAGSPDFNQAMTRLLLGAEHPAIVDERVSIAQTPGGCGALRMAAEFLRRVNPEITVWLSDPTWANHNSLLGGAGLKTASYGYYDKVSHGVDFDAMLASLEGAQAGDVVLLHGCCHNPSGADLNQDQWLALADLFEQKGLLPFIDIAYQGLGDGLEDDAFGVRLMARRLPEVVVASSCSKNFGLYRERTGAVMLISKDSEQAQAAGSYLFNTIRAHYSMPPAHGGAIVETILGDAGLTEQWLEELGEMRQRIQMLRHNFAARLAAEGHDFSFIERQKGMFSFLGISVEQIHRLRDEFSIYIVDSSRVNVAGLSDSNLDYVVDSLVKVLK